MTLKSGIQGVSAMPVAFPWVVYAPNPCVCTQDYEMSHACGIRFRSRARCEIDQKTYDKLLTTSPHHLKPPEPAVEHGRPGIFSWGAPAGVAVTVQVERCAHGQFGVVCEAEADA
jgi:hypothetical protein